MTGWRTSFPRLLLYTSVILVPFLAYFGPDLLHKLYLQEILSRVGSDTSTSTSNEPLSSSTTIMATAEKPAGRAPVISLTHGGGPLPLLDEPNHRDITRSMKTRVPEILGLGTARAPRAIVLVTAHWTTAVPTVSSGARHPLLFDYYNFPKETYEYKYPAPGSPEVAAEVARALREEGLEPELDDERGWDHGVFVPMMLVNPKADVPVVQVSVLESEDPAAHLAMGRALARLRDAGVAIVGSGYASFHNFGPMRDGTMDTPAFAARNAEWSRALGEAVADSDSDSRASRLSGWRSLPHAYEMHPRGGAEHFLPLIVCAAAGGPGPARSYADRMKNIDVWSYYWE